MAELFKLNDELGFPGADKLYLAAKRRGLKVTKAQAKLVAERNVGGQTVAPLQPSRGKTVAENPNARWQMDLAHIANDNKKGDDRYILNVSNVFDRKLYSEPLETTSPVDVTAALKKIVARAPRLPYTISSDRGIEFTDKRMGNYVNSLGVAQRFKDVGDVNAIAVVDRSMGLLKRKLANIGAMTGANWGAALQRATKALNDEPKEHVLHGASPNEVKDDENVKFMLLQDNAKNMVVNQKVVDQREDALKKTMAFRAPISVNRKFKRGFRAAYGPVVKAESVNKNIVKGRDGLFYSLKTIKPVPADSRETV